MTRLLQEKKVAVLGNGETACRVCEALLSRGFPVLLAMSQETDGAVVPFGAEYLPETILVSAKGEVGNFTLDFQAPDGRKPHRAGFIVIAYETDREPSHDILGEPLHKRIWSLSRLEDELADRGFSSKECGKVLFLDRLDGLGTAAESERFLGRVIALQEEQGIACCLVTCQVKVASPGLEMLYGRMRDGGCIVAKTDSLHVEVASEGVRCLFDDFVLDDEVSVVADLLVVGERECPSPELGNIAAILGLETDPRGFLQGDNLLRAPCLTNRRGVLAAGGSAGTLSEWEQIQNISAVVGEVVNLARWLDEVPSVDQILYDRDRCATCLTCFRVCPHGAVLFTDKPTFLPRACQRCGICASLCPNEAIELSGFEKPAVFEHLFSEKEHGTGKETHLVTGFVCQRSADLIQGYLEKDDSIIGNVHWVEVPCAGTIRSQYILETLARRKDVNGVLVVSCHRDNCRSGTGTVRAANIVRQVKGLLRTLEMDDRLVEHIPLAPNEQERLKLEIGQFFERKG
jgi:quinone-modifying oxidoreductase subunit QmoB